MSDVIFRLAKLDDKKKEEIVDKAISKLKDKKKDKKKTDKKKTDEVEVDGMSAPPEEMGDMKVLIDDLSSEIENIKSDGKIETSEVIGFFDKMMEMVTSLINAKPKVERKKKSSQDDIEDGMIERMASDSIIERLAHEYLSSRGNQINRKDKDTMVDTGGSSKGRDREPDIKPPRDDVKNRFKPKKQIEKDSDSNEDSDNRPD